MKYLSLITWDGSPNGCIVKTYQADTEYNHSDLGDELAEVALEEKWIEVVEEKKAPASKKVTVTLEIIKDGMTIPEMQKALKGANIVSRSKKEDTLAKLILKHNLFGGI